MQDIIWHPLRRPSAAANNLFGILVYLTHIVSAFSEAALTLPNCRIIAFTSVTSAARCSLLLCPQHYRSNIRLKITQNV